MSTGGERGRIVSGPGANIEDSTRVSWNEVQNVAVHLFKAESRGEER
jgi:hypothetical protein